MILLRCSKVRFALPSHLRLRLRWSDRPYGSCLRDNFWWSTVRLVTPMWEVAVCWNGIRCRLCRWCRRVVCRRVQRCWHPGWQCCWSHPWDCHLSVCVATSFAFDRGLVSTFAHSYYYRFGLLSENAAQFAKHRFIIYIYYLTKATK